MKIFHDWEFIDDGRTIDVISVGMVAEDGRRLYLVNADDGIIERAFDHGDGWLRRNVLEHLPIKTIRYAGAVLGWEWDWDGGHPDRGAVVYDDVMRIQVERFIGETPDPELWAWYGAYDHVAYAQLFGPMAKLPQGFPMWTNDIKQEARRLGDPSIPNLYLPGEVEHHALHDALVDMRRLAWLREYEREQRLSGHLD